MKRLLLAAGMAVILHALLLGAEAEWLKTRVARRMLPEPLSISLQYQEIPKKTEASPKKRPALAIPTPRTIFPTPSAPKALDAPEMPPFKVPVKPPGKRTVKVEKPKEEHPKKREDVKPLAVPAESLPDDWMQIPQSLSGPAREEAPAAASVAPVQEKAGDIPERPAQEASAPAPAPLVEAVPMYRKNPAPVYPRAARRRGYEGRVILEVLVNEQGRVEDLRVFESSGYKLLDRAAMKSVQKWLFEPARRGEEKVEMWVRVPIRFDLQ